MDKDVRAFHVPQFVKPLLEGVEYHHLLGRLKRACRQEANARNILWLLRVHRGRPSCSGGPEQSDELAPCRLIELHSGPH
jgi:hypothetical protein